MPYLKHKNVQLASQLILGAVFVYAGMGKISNTASFATTISNYMLLPKFLVGPIAIVLPLVELLFGITLILNVWVRASALILSALLVVFMVAIFSTLLRGINIDCGCFAKITIDSQVRSGSSWSLITRDLLFLVPGIITIFCRNRNIDDYKERGVG